MAYFGSNNVDDLHRVINYAKNKHGIVNVLGFSDGKRLIDDYIGKYGENDVNRFFAVAERQSENYSSRRIDLIGDRDHLTPLSKKYLDNFKNPDLMTVYGGHTFFVRDPQTIREVAAIMKAATPTRAYFTTRNYEAPSMRRAA